VADEFTKDMAHLAIEREFAPEPKEAPALVEKRIKQYIKVRDTIKAADEEHAKKMQPLKDLQDVLTGWMQRFLEHSGADSIKTSEGTCYSTTRYSASLADPQAFMQYVITNNQFDLLDRKANVTACRDYVKDHGVLPPGVNMSSISTVGVRRAPGK
jgi:hypothetical protein